MGVLAFSPRILKGPKESFTMYRFLENPMYNV